MSRPPFGSDMAEYAFARGQAANEEGLPQSANPFSRFVGTHGNDGYWSFHVKWWNEGWRDAQKVREEWEELCDGSAS